LTRLKRAALRRDEAGMRAVIFDIDGTLIDSVDLHARAWVEAFAHFGIQTDQSAVRSQIGKGGDELMPVFLTRERIERKYLPEVRPFPGVRPLFERIRADGLTIALASSGKRSEVERYTDILKIGDLVDVATSSDDADRSKPHPDIFKAALAKLDSKPSDTVHAVGDTPYDAEAAGKAGVPTLGLLCGGFPEADLSAAGCVAIFRDPQDLLDGFDRSPLAQR
jgi:HAD superfamily hydrolase (TIGR01509 family)